MGIDFYHLWQEMPWPVRAVVIVLTMQLVASIAVTVDRLVFLARSGAASKVFAAKAGPLIDAGLLYDAMDAASKAERSHLALFMHTGIGTYLKRTAKGDDAVKAADLARRALERKGETIGEDLNRGMTVLASTGSTAPFVGLLGTVLGILNAFKLIASTGSGGIGTIGGTIGEALIVTGYGLVVAIPAVLVFNWLSGRIARYETGLVNASGEVVDRLEADAFDQEDAPGQSTEAAAE